jgi:cytochrome c biogenesis factor
MMFLLFFLLGVIVGIAVYWFRIREMPQHVVKYSAYSRELMLYLGSTILLFLSIFLLVTGMNLNAAEASASLAIVFAGDGKRREMKDVLLAEISTKPLILLVWAGALLIVLGLLLAALKRREDTKPRGDLSDQSVSEKKESTPSGSIE